MPRQVPLRDYIDNKITMLEEEFLINLEDAEIYHLRNLKTEAEVNHYVHQIIINKL